MFVKMIMIKKSFRLVVLSIVIAASFTSCLSVDRFEKEEKIRISAYIGSHADIPFILKPSGLYYAEILEGTGVQPVAHDTVFILFEGRYLTDIVFTTNFGTTDTLITAFGEGNLLQGFEEAVSYMKEGGKSKAIVPSELGYGNSGYYFPAFTPIVYEIHLVKVESGPEAK